MKNQKSPPSLKLELTKTNCDSDQTTCPCGCCSLGTDMYCCSDCIHCAATADECPFGPKIFKDLLKKKEAKDNCDGPNETKCPRGCCPEANWYCCPAGCLCAPTADECPWMDPLNILNILWIINQIHRKFQNFIRCFRVGQNTKQLFFGVV